MRCKKISEQCEGDAVRGEQYCPACRRVMIERMRFRPDGSRYLVDPSDFGESRPAGWSVDDDAIQEANADKGADDSPADEDDAAAVQDVSQSSRL